MAKKSNEVTAIPELLRLIELGGAIVVIDPMGCQLEVAEAIVEGGGDYIRPSKPTRQPGTRES